jgi:transposase InsO family protein
MNLPRSSYYYKPKKKEPDDLSLLKRIEELAEEFSRYGYRRITAQLHREGFQVNHKKVLRLMRERGLLCKLRRRGVRTTDSTHGYPLYPNLLPEGPLTAPNRVWVADITYIRIWMGFVYLAVILDLFSRKAIGYGLSRNIDTLLSLKALRMALQSRNPPPGVIHHSDQGVQYAAGDYVDTLRFHGFQISMARKGNPYDNAVVESFLKTLKAEEVDLWEYQTLADVENRIPYFIEQVYNRKRLHSSLNYRPPDEFERMFHMNNHPNPCLTALA